MQTASFRVRIFQIVLWLCVAFVLLSALAMLFYPGGTRAEPKAPGYSFLTNYFSDLGRVRARNGVLNPIAAPLFEAALTLAGAGLMLFFAAFTGLFQGGLWVRVGALWGGALGILAGICFIGVAATPADISRWHGTFVIWAFRFFLVSVLTFALVIFCQKTFPKIGAWLFMAFAGLLASYIELLIYGPGASTPHGLIIQVTGQKLIVYASVLCVGMQAVLARRYLAHQQHSQM
jgi:hypothetical membrane protein